MTDKKGDQIKIALIVILFAGAGAYFLFDSGVIGKVEKTKKQEQVVIPPPISIVATPSVEENYQLFSGGKTDIVERVNNIKRLQDNYVEESLNNDLDQLQHDKKMRTLELQERQQQLALLVGGKPIESFSTQNAGEVATEETELALTGITNDGLALITFDGVLHQLRPGMKSGEVKLVELNARTNSAKVSVGGAEFDLGMHSISLRSIPVLEQSTSEEPSSDPGDDLLDPLLAEETDLSEG